MGGEVMNFINIKDMYNNDQPVVSFINIKICRIYRYVQ
jgi:hypothetical protein